MGHKDNKSVCVRKRERHTHTGRRVTAVHRVTKPVQEMSIDWESLNG